MPPETEIPGNPAPLVPMLLLPAPPPAAALPAPRPLGPGTVTLPDGGAEGSIPVDSSTLLPLPPPTVTRDEEAPPCETRTLVLSSRTGVKGTSGAPSPFDDPTTKWPDSSASGIGGAISGGTATALRTTTAFGMLTTMSAVNTGEVWANPRELSLKLAAMLGGACSATAKERLVGILIGRAGTATLGLTVIASSGSDGAVCTTCGAA